MIFGVNLINEAGNLIYMPFWKRKKAEIRIDPLCGKEVDPKLAMFSEHMGETYYFCSGGCKQKWEENPHKHPRM